MPSRKRSAELPPEQPPMELRHYTLREIARRMKPMVAPHRRRLILAVSMVGVAAACVSLMPLLPKIIIDYAIPQRSIRLAAVVAGTFLGVALVRMASYYLATLTLLWVGEDVVFKMRQAGFRHLQRLCLRFHSRYPSGFLYNRVFEQAICQIGVFLRTIFSTLMIHGLGLVFSIIACMVLNPPMTGLILVGAVGYVFVSRRLSPRIHRRALEAHDSHNRIAGFILDRIRGTKTIQAFSMEDRVDRDFDETVWPMQVRWIYAQKEVLRLQLFTEGLTYLITSGVLVTGAYMIVGWEMKLGTLVAFMGYQAQFTGIIASLANIYGQSAIARAGFDQFQTVLETQSTVTDSAAKPMPARITGELAFHHVSFAYDRKPVLQDVDFAAPPGQVVALVGRSGGGKTTLTNLMLRFYDVDAGAITLDGGDIRELPLREYRALFGVVLQDPFLFDDTIEMNLRCARPDANADEIIEALERAQAMDFVREFPDGLNHRVGEGGAQLSGGQRQRLSIARCMLLQPKFLILDEATSALDNETERSIQRALEELFRDRTAFVIAHRLSTVRRADRILVIEDGGVVEDGNFQELLELGGSFARLHSIATSTSTRSLKLEEAGFAQ